MSWLSRAAAGSMGGFMRVRGNLFLLIPRIGACGRNNEGTWRNTARFSFVLFLLDRELRESGFLLGKKLGNAPPFRGVTLCLQQFPIMLDIELDDRPCGYTHRQAQSMS